MENNIENSILKLRMRASGRDCPEAFLLHKNRRRDWGSNMNPYMLQVEDSCRVMRLFSGMLGSLNETGENEYQRVSERKEHIWNRRLAESRNEYARSVELLASVLSQTADAADRHSVEDRKTEKLLGRVLKKRGIQMENMQIRVLSRDRIGIEFRLKGSKGRCISNEDLANWISSQLGREMKPSPENPPCVGERMQRFLFLERTRYHTTYGVARIGKSCESVSGDNFSFVDRQNGWQMAAVSDGMGAGEDACRESARVIDMLEEFLQAGLKCEDAVRLINAAIVLGRNEVRFSTLDIHEWNLYTGQCRSLKAGASVTFLKRGEEIRKLYSDTLPVGVIQELQLAVQTTQLEDGDFLIMVTDGVLDALPVQEQDFLMEGIIRGARTGNPTEMAHHILQQVLEWQGGEPRDDMLVLVTGIWEQMPA